MAPQENGPARNRIERQVTAKETRKVKARREGDRSVWFGLGMFGLVGWSVTIPAVAGVILGAWIDAQWPSRVSWKLTLLFVGLIAGCANAWRWMHRESKEE